MRNRERAEFGTEEEDEEGEGEDGEELAVLELGAGVVRRCAMVLRVCDCEVVLGVVGVGQETQGGGMGFLGGGETEATARGRAKFQVLRWPLSSGLVGWSRAIRALLCHCGLRQFFQISPFPQKMGASESNAGVGGAGTGLMARDTAGDGVGRKGPARGLRWANRIALNVKTGPQRSGDRLCNLLIT